MTNELKWELQDLVNNALDIDGGHHKQWYLIQIAKLLNIETYEYDQGIAP